MPNQQFDERILTPYNVRFGADEGTDLTPMENSGIRLLRIDSLFACNFDSIDHTLLLGVQGGLLCYPFAVVPLPAAVAGVPSIVNVFAAAFSGQYTAIFNDAFPFVGQMIEAATDNATPVTVVWFGGTL